MLDSLFKELQKDGVAKDTKYAEIISKEDKIKLWETIVIGTENPKALLRAVFFLSNFCLRGGQEHRDLKLSQLVKCTSPSLHYLYLENSSKNNPGAHFKQEAKRVQIQKQVTSATFIFWTYISVSFLQMLGRKIISMPDHCLTSLVTLISLGSHLYQWEKICCLPC